MKKHNPPLSPGEGFCIPRWGAAGPLRACPWVNDGSRRPLSPITPLGER
jgi:hypothetical protein